MYILMSTFMPQWTSYLLNKFEQEQGLWLYTWQLSSNSSWNEHFFGKCIPEIEHTLQSGKLKLWFTFYSQLSLKRVSANSLCDMHTWAEAWPLVMFGQNVFDHQWTSYVTWAKACTWIMLCCVRDFLLFLFYLLIQLNPLLLPRFSNFQDLMQFFQNHFFIYSHFTGIDECLCSEKSKNRWLIKVVYSASVVNDFSCSFHWWKMLPMLFFHLHCDFCC